MWMRMCVRVCVCMYVYRRPECYHTDTEFCVGAVEGRWVRGSLAALSKLWLGVAGRGSRFCAWQPRLQ